MVDLIIPKIWEGKEICICVTDERAVFVYDKEQNKFIDTGETAIELPSHGDLIDRKELLKHQFKVYDSNEEVCEDYMQTYHILEAPVVLEANDE